MRILTIFAFMVLGIGGAFAQTFITTSEVILREWDKDAEEWGEWGDKMSQAGFFKVNGKNSIVFSTTNLSTTYFVTKYELEEFKGREIYAYHVTSENGNDYLFRFDLESDVSQVRIIDYGSEVQACYIITSVK